MQKINNLLHRNRDANGNGIPDSQERTMYNAPLNDRNMNGIPDNQEKVPLGQKVKNALHLNRDANHNGIPDSQERDRNHNGIPDAQEKVPLGQKVKNVLHLSRDANHNGIPDSQERGYGYNSSLADRNHNGIPDSQERGFSRMPAVPAPFLERRSALHRELLGRNGQWNLRGAQTRSYLPRDYYNMETQFNTQNESLIRTLAPVNVERIEKEVVVHEHLHPVEKEEIQPVIFREREQLDIKQITQQLHETQIQPTLIQQRELAAEVRAPIVERSAPIQENIVLPSVDRDATMRSQVVHAPIVNETIKKTVIEEIQPVLERDVIQSTLIQETKPIYEKVIEAPIVYRETTVVNDRGVSGGSLEQLTAQGFNLGSYSGLSNDRNMNGIPDNLERRNFSNDRNMNGIPDNLERGNFSNDRNMNGIPDNLERTSGFGTTGLSNDRNMNGIPDNLERRNPLDRNGDGKVDLKDLTGRPGYGQQGLAGGLSNDRNMNGIPDNLERSAVDRNMNGIPDNQERFGAKTLNPLDRNNDGKVDLKDLTANKQQTPFRAF